MSKRLQIWGTLLIVLAASYVLSAQLTIPYTFTAGTTIDPDQMNSNFSTIATGALNRTGGTLTGSVNLNGQTLSGAATATGVWTFTNNATIGGTLGVTGATTVGDFRGTAETITATGTVNDQALGATTTILRLNNASLLTLTGLAGCSAGRVLVLQSVGAGRVELAHQNTGSAAGNRFINAATSGHTPLAAGSGTARYYCDGTQGRWVLLQHEQGAWITPTFAAGDFTGSAAMTWTVAAGDVTAMQYRLSGRTLQVNYFLTTTTVGGTPASALKIANGQWGGFTAPAAAVRTMAAMINNGAGSDGAALVEAGNSINSYVNTGLATAWAAATDNTVVTGMLAFEVN